MTTTSTTAPVLIYSDAETQQAWAAAARGDRATIANLLDEADDLLIRAREDIEALASDVARAARSGDRAAMAEALDGQTFFARVHAESIARQHEIRRSRDSL